MSAKIQSSFFAFLLLAVGQFAHANPALTGSWFNPERDGEGFHVEILDNNQALVIWFTYPGSSDNLQTEQAWILGIGTVNGDTITIVDAYRTRGPKFGEGYDKDALEEYAWGDMSFSFTGPDKGTVNYDGDGGTGSTEITRLTRLVAPGEAGGLPGGISGAWYDPETNGQGWFVEIISNRHALVYWFTYDDNGNQAWNLGVGNIVGRSVVVREAEAGRGARFGADFDAGDVIREPFADLSLSWDSCGSGEASFFTSEGDIVGSFPMTRLTVLAGYPCSELPDTLDGQLTMMSNPSDAVMARFESPGGTTFDSYGDYDGEDDPATVSGALAFLPNDEEVRMSFDPEQERYSIVHSRTGLSFTFRKGGNGDRQVTVIDPLSGRSVTLPVSQAGGEDTQASKPDPKSAVPDPAPTAAPPGNRTESHQPLNAGIVIEYCDGPTAGANVEFIFGEKDTAIADPTKPGFSRRAGLVVPAVVEGSGAQTRYVATVPANELTHRSLGDMTRGCGYLDEKAKGACKVVEISGGFCANVVGEIRSPVSFGGIHDIYNMCSNSMAVVEEYCGMHEFLELRWCASGSVLSEYRKPREDVWVRAEMAGVTNGPQYSPGSPHSINLVGGNLFNDYDFGVWTLEGTRAILTDAYTDPGFVVAGNGYAGRVGVECLSEGDQLTAKRLRTNETFTCTVDATKACSFTIPSTETSWTEDVFDITGPRNLKSSALVKLILPGGPVSDLSGNWFVQELVHAEDCDEGVFQQSYSASVTQTGNDLSVCAFGICLDGTIQGSNVAWSGSYPEDGGTTTTSVAMTLSQDGNQLTGGSDWSWTDGTSSGSCSGTTDITATRQ